MSTSAAQPFVVAIIATYNRRREMNDLLRLLEQTCGLAAIVVADNAADPEVRALTDRVSLPTGYIALETNDGPGPARNRAIALARAKWGDVLTHYWILDDDVRFSPDILVKLLAALADNNAQLVAPLITGSGAVFTWPELDSRSARRMFASRDRSNPAAFTEGVDPRNLPRINACTAVCFLMERICGDTVPFREDFWLLVGDVEHTARIAEKFRAVFCPFAVVEHFWGTPLDPLNPQRSDYLRACAALQNNLFMLTHRLRSRFIIRSVLGSLKRFVLRHLSAPEALYDFFAIIWNATVRGEPAGAASGKRLRLRRSNYEPR